MALARYTICDLSSVSFAVIGPDDRSMAICDRRADAERIVNCLNLVAESEKTAHPDEERT